MDGPQLLAKTLQWLLGICQAQWSALQSPVSNTTKNTQGHSCDFPIKLDHISKAREIKCSLIKKGLKRYHWLIINWEAGQNEYFYGGKQPQGPKGVCSFARVLKSCHWFIINWEAGQNEHFLWRKIALKEHNKLIWLQTNSKTSIN